MAGQLAIMPRPRGGDWLPQDVRRISQAGVTVLASLLESQEVVELELDSLPGSCLDAGIQFRSFPIPDRGVPSSMTETREFLATLNAEVDGGAAVALHCRMGIGRSSMIAAAILVSHGLSVSDAFSRIQNARGVHVPDTMEQERWVERFRALSTPGTPT